MLGRREGKDQTTLQTFGEKKQQQNQELKKSAASKARHIQLVTCVLPEPGLEAGIESVKERITHATVWQSWLLSSQQQGTCSGVLQLPSSPQHSGLLGFAFVKKQADWSTLHCTSSPNNWTSNFAFCHLEAFCLSQHKHISGSGGSSLHCKLHGSGIFSIFLKHCSCKILCAMIKRAVVGFVMRFTRIRSESCHHVILL